jgi:hypothetical protein
MLEVVLVARGELVTGRREEVTASAVSALAEMGLPGRLVPGTDAFFMPESSGSRMIQKLKELKREYIEERNGTALFSVNNHETHFARRYGLGEGIESSCIAFGIERLVGAGLAAWGPDDTGWPEAIRRP